MTLLQSAEVVGSGALRKRVAAAIAEAADDIENEDEGTANHTARLAWAEHMLAGNIEAQMEAIIWRVALNPTVAAAGSDATDNDIQFVVNGLVAAMVADHGA